MDRQIDRWIDRQIDRQIDRSFNIISECLNVTRFGTAVCQLTYQRWTAQGGATSTVILIVQYSF